jgi:hypothetical protein
VRIRGSASDEPLLSFTVEGGRVAERALTG